MKRWIRELNYYASALRDLVFPRRCIVCGTLLSGCEHDLCLKCYSDIPLTYFWKWYDNPAEVRMSQRCGIQRAASLFFYRNTGGYSHIVHKIKYDGRLGLGRRMGSLLGTYLREGAGFEHIDAIVPVPIHRLRRWKRGYNQAETICFGLSDSLSLTKHIPVVSDLVSRVKRTKTQTRLSGDAKRENVKNAFRMNPDVASRLNSKGILHLLIVDDVLTSGSTLEAIITILLQHFEVSVATLGFVE
ncbi:MAG: ComF family protein [Bacteroidales bacterium]|nr:ComF family protein [Bacteroidales bacterium]MDD3201260.1 ComF family protein [Bacteroidales bacterium]